MLDDGQSFVHYDDVLEKMEILPLSHYTESPEKTIDTAITLLLYCGKDVLFRSIVVVSEPNELDYVCVSRGVKRDLFVLLVL